MAKSAAEWTDARLDDLAASLAAVPTQVAILGATVDHLDHAVLELETVPGQLAVLSAAVERLTDENRALRAELAATQRQLIQIAWGLVAAMIGAAAALLAALV
jgi:prefoldin subunit 5